MSACHLDKIEQLARTNIRNEDVQMLILQIISKDKEEQNQFDLEKYWEFYEEMDRLGKVQMDIWKTDQTLGKWKENVNVLRAALKFKKALKK